MTAATILSRVEVRPPTNNRVEVDATFFDGAVLVSAHNCGADVNIHLSNAEALALADAIVAALRNVPVTAEGVASDA